ncbi:unnamed protein product [Darwinula stevensoni]|uniref:Uncharacterized protein n=1 Tax=Darwinula stevensoni TaxID=69355 RepID=A0A7R9FPW2_9CRUS|nr:unnamed protein product [Darwinula stevensoni]CAG0898623.1 unnamed protein product [Darwinula stevensoni]
MREFDSPVKGGGQEEMREFNGSISTMSVNPSDWSSMTLKCFQYSSLKYPRPQLKVEEQLGPEASLDGVPQVCSYMMASRINVSTPMMTTNEEDKGKDMDANYALQVALRHMKERCQKQQARIQLLEEENRKLIQQKSDLYEEIGKLQENNIKLRERNLSLNHEIHSKHQECCSIRESLTSMTQEKAKLGLQIPKLEAQIESLQKILRTKDQTVTPQLKSSVNVFQAPFSSHDIGTQTKAVDGHMKALISAMKSLLNRDFATKWNGLHPAMVPFEKMVQFQCSPPTVLLLWKPEQPPLPSNALELKEKITAAEVSYTRHAAIGKSEENIKLVANQITDTSKIHSQAGAQNCPQPVTIRQNVNKLKVPCIKFGLDLGHLLLSRGVFSFSFCYAPLSLQLLTLFSLSPPLSLAYFLLCYMHTLIGCKKMEQTLQFLSLLAMLLQKFIFLGNSET